MVLQGDGKFYCCLFFLLLTEAAFVCCLKVAC